MQGNFLKIKNCNNKVCFVIVVIVSMFDVVKEIFISEKKFSETKYKRLQKPLVYI